MRRTGLLCVFALALLSPAVRGSIITGYTPTLPGGNPTFFDPLFDRFNNNFPTNQPPTTGSNTLLFEQTTGTSIDLTGVGWVVADTRRIITMVSNINFITAAHAGLLPNFFSAGSQVSFLTSGGTVFTTTIASSGRVPSLPGAPNPTTDIVFGTLSTPVPTGVTFYPIATGPLLPTTPVGIYTQEHRLGLNRPSFLVPNVTLGENDSTNTVLYNFAPNELAIGFNPGETIFTTGDSGAPSFIVEGGQVRLLGHHMAVTNIAGVDYSIDSFLPDYKATIDALIAIPEPSSIALAGVGAAAVWARRRRSPV
jgi:hypothetical protein